MDPNSQTALRFPLVARFRPACLPLPDRVVALSELAGRAARQRDQGLASTVFNQSALLASDIGLPDLARTMCHRHANAYLQAGPLTAASAIRGLEPLINLARLQIRAGNTDEGRQRLLDLYQAVSSGNGVTFEGIVVPADLTRTDEDRKEVRAWLWRVLLADGTRTLTSTGRWKEALTHIEEHHGVGNRMLDGRQVAVITALTDGDTGRAAELLATTDPGDDWERNVTDCLTLLCRRETKQPYEDAFAELADRLGSEPDEPGLTVFHIRLRLAALNAAANADSPGCHILVYDLTHRTLNARDGYAAREVLADHAFAQRAASDMARRCAALVKACGLGAEALPDAYSASLMRGLTSSEAILTRSLAQEQPT